MAVHLFVPLGSDMRASNNTNRLPVRSHESLRPLLFPSIKCIDEIPWFQRQSIIKLISTPIAHLMKFLHRSFVQYRIIIIKISFE